jgi:hypothetical protein
MNKVSVLKKEAVCFSETFVSTHNSHGGATQNSIDSCTAVRTPISHTKGEFWYFVSSQVLTVASMKMTVFWDVAPHSLLIVYRRFRLILAQAYKMQQSGKSRYKNNFFMFSATGSKDFHFLFSS